MNKKYENNHDFVKSLEQISSNMGRAAAAFRAASISLKESSEKMMKSNRKLGK